MVYMVRVFVCSVVRWMAWWCGQTSFWFSPLCRGCRTLWFYSSSLYPFSMGQFRSVCLSLSLSLSLSLCVCVCVCVWGLPDISSAWKKDTRKC